MSTTKYNDGTAYEAISVEGKSIYFQGAKRDALEIQYAKSTVSFDALDKLTADSNNTKKITLNDGSKEFVHDNYCLRVELAIKPFVITAATSTTPEVTEDRTCVTLAQLTYAEVQTANNTAAIDALTLATLGVK